MKVLVLDIGGSNVKMRMTGQEERTKFSSGPAFTPQDLLAGLKEHAADWDYEAVTVGFPAPVLAGRLPREPKHLGGGWTDFDFEKELGKPVKLINDAAMQAVGSYEGGRTLFLSLGTGLGSALISDYHVIATELCELRWSKSSTIESQVAKAKKKHLGPKRWEERVHLIVEMLRKSLLPDSIVIGGGEAKHLKELPAGARRVDNDMALEGGEAVWNEPRFQL
ncbi:ROK family protein [Haloferula sargassicola]|uniref:ROK family protein n=1 Tax=Haloferula sargassicola TaxID=490096 RepID=A0ABP9UR54_9BACT